MAVQEDSKDVVNISVKEGHFEKVVDRLVLTHKAFGLYERVNSR